MQVAEVSGDMTKVSSFAPSALYALASGTVPEPIRQEFLRRAKGSDDSLILVIHVGRQHARG